MRVRNDSDDASSFCESALGLAEELIRAVGDGSTKRALLMTHPDTAHKHGGFADARLSAAAFRSVHAAVLLVAGGQRPTRELCAQLLEHPVLAALCYVLPVFLVHEATGAAPACGVRVQEPVLYRDLAHGRAVVSFKSPLTGELLHVPVTPDAFQSGDSATLVVPGKGHAPLFEGSCGPIHVEVALEAHPLFSLDRVVSPFDVHVSLDVSIQDYYYGCQRSVPLPGGGEVQAEYRGDGSRVLVFRGEGLASIERERGDMYVFFSLQLPSLAPAVLRRPLVRMFFAVLFGSTAVDAGEEKAL